MLNPVFVASVTCTDNFDGASRGEVSSYNYPGNYSNDMICVYTISVPDGLVLLNFTEMDIQSSPNCVNDAVTVS